MNALFAAVLLGMSTVLVAQTPKGDSSGALTQERKCDALTGAKKEQCLRDARRDSRGSCDALIGPEKERCLKQGGTVEAGGGSSSPKARRPWR